MDVELAFRCALSAGRFARLDLCRDLEITSRSNAAPAGHPHGACAQCTYLLAFLFTHREVLCCSFCMRSSPSQQQRATDPVGLLQGTHPLEVHVKTAYIPCYVKLHAAIQYILISRQPDKLSMLVYYQNPTLAPYGRLAHQACPKVAACHTPPQTHHC